MVGSEVAAFNSVWRQRGDSSTSEEVTGWAQGSSAPSSPEGEDGSTFLCGSSSWGCGRCGEGLVLWGHTGREKPAPHSVHQPEFNPSFFSLSRAPWHCLCPTLAWAVPLVLPRALALPQAGGDLGETPQGGNTFTPHCLSHVILLSFPVKT